MAADGGGSTGQVSEPKHKPATRMVEGLETADASASTPAETGVDSVSGEQGCQCQALTARLEDCDREALPGKKYCWQHGLMIQAQTAASSAGQVADASTAQGAKKKHAHKQYENELVMALQDAAARDLAGSYTLLREVSYGFQRRATSARDAKPKSESGKTARADGILVLDKGPDSRVSEGLLVGASAGTQAAAGILSVQHALPRWILLITKPHDHVYPCR